MEAFCTWLSNTPLSMIIQNNSWVIPSVQSVHILAISIVMASAVMIDLRLLGAFSRTQSVLDTTQRYAPWIWCAVAVLAMSGALLIIGEPGRELESQVFWLKMTLLVCALALTGTYQYVATHVLGFWERRRGMAGVVAVVSLVLWVGIVAAGRWIAYWEHG
ncbi:MAG TPA: DUF6644 family protein [Steroidobacteraceae bacterium]|nr:DUF6644 family protein [Steroidobacteraceae bacterium]